MEKPMFIKYEKVGPLDEQDPLSLDNPLKLECNPHEEHQEDNKEGITSVIVKQEAVDQDLEEKLHPDQSDSLATLSAVMEPSTTDSIHDVPRRKIRNRTSAHKIHTCSVCSKTFPENWLLRRHLTIHKNEKPFACSMCEKKLASKDSLRRHSQAHLKKGSFVCTVCLRAFDRHEYLQKHLYVHLDERPHKCAVCNKKFARRDILRVHVKTHIGFEVCDCKDCGDSLRSVEMIVQPHCRVYCCDICDKRHFNSYSLKRHKADCHK